MVTGSAGAHHLGGFLFTARILPCRDGIRSDAARRIGVTLSLTPSNEIDIHVLEHARLNGICIDQLNLALLALDYDGTTHSRPARNVASVR